MENPTWMEPTLRRIREMGDYPDRLNEFGCPKITERVMEGALGVLRKCMGEHTPAPRIVPTLEGGLLVEILEYWVDLLMEVAPDGSTKVSLRGDPDFLAGVEGNGASDCEIFERGVRAIEKLRKEGPPEIEDKRAGGKKVSEELKLD